MFSIEKWHGKTSKRRRFFRVFNARLSTPFFDTCRCFTKFGTLSVERCGKDKCILSDVDKTLQMYFPLLDIVLLLICNLLFKKILMFANDFIRGRSFTSHDPYTWRLWAVVTVLEVFLLYLSERIQT